MSNKLIIDAVITWVDSSNKIWRKKINKFLKKPINWEDKKSSTRYNSINEIEITIISILKYASYFRNIFLVTDNQKPKNFDILKEKAKKYNINLILIDHKDIFKGFEKYLPTFNSQSIETLLFKIPGLSEHFVYFNDDLFLINETKQADFFEKGFPILRGKWINFSKNIEKEATHLKAKELGAKIAGHNKLYDFYHTPHPLRKSTFENFFKTHQDVLIKNIKYKFRHINQFVPQSLANHLELKNKTCVKESESALLFIQKYNFWKVYSRLFMLRYDKKLIFMCLQSLETAKPFLLEKISYWIGKKFNVKLEKL